jgi:hypothetical protein
MKAKHQALFEETSATFDPQRITEWEAMVVAWENDMSKPDPYSEGDVGKQHASISLSPTNM